MFNEVIFPNMMKINFTYLFFESYSSNLDAHLTESNSLAFICISICVAWHDIHDRISNNEFIDKQFGVY